MGKKKPPASTGAKRKAIARSPEETLAIKALAAAMGDLQNRLGVEARPTKPLEQARRAFFLAASLYASGAVGQPTPDRREFGSEMLANATFQALKESLDPELRLDPRVAHARQALKAVVVEMVEYVEGSEGRDFGQRLAAASQHGLTAIGQAEAHGG